MPGNERRSERFERLERFHHLLLEAHWPCAYRASAIIHDDDDVHVFPPAGRRNRHGTCYVDIDPFQIFAFPPTAFLVR